MSRSSRVLRRHYKAGAPGAAKVHDVEVAPHEDRFRGVVDGRATEFDARLLAGAGVGAAGAEIVLLHEGARKRAFVVRDGDVVHVHMDGRTWKLQAVTPRPGAEGTSAEAADPFAPSPMTGVVRKVLVKPGDAVKSGATLFVVEAMKMEFAVPAPRDVVIDAVKCAEGDRVDIQQIVVTFRAEAKA